MVSGCSSKKEYELVSPVSTSSDTNEVDDSVDYSSFYNTKIEISNDTNLYDESNNVVGTVLQGSYLDIDEGNENLLSVKDTDYKVDGKDVQVSNRWFKNTNHLVPYNEELTTNSNYSLQDVKGNTVINFNKSNTYTVYVKPSSDDERYGVLFQNAIYYISSNEVSDEYLVEGTTQELSTSIPVLMYHFFYSEENGETRTDGNYVEVNELDEQLNYITSNGFTALTMREILYFMEDRAQIPSKSLAITIDDGDPTVHKYAYPVFQKYGLNATLFLICGWEDATMSYDFWEMREDGLELQSHGFLTHQGGCSGMGHGGKLLCMDHDEGVEDTKMSLDYVDGGFVYCYPFGDVNDSAKQILNDAGVKMAFTTANGWISPGMDLLELPRVRVHGGNSLESFANSIL
jgi:peptidoglycan/xylan/chitin deacetylase (PgdA/CDA1 family)